MSKLWINCDDKKNGEIVLTDKLSEDLSCLYLSPEYADVYFLVDNEKLPGKSHFNNNMLIPSNSCFLFP